MSLDRWPHYFILFVWLDHNDLYFKFYVHEKVGRREFFPLLPWWTGMIWNHELVSLESPSLLKYDKWYCFINYSMGFYHYSFDRNHYQSPKSFDSLWLFLSFFIFFWGWNLTIRIFNTNKSIFEWHKLFQKPTAIKREIYFFFFISRVVQLCFW